MDFKPKYLLLWYKHCSSGYGF